MRRLSELIREIVDGGPLARTAAAELTEALHERLGPRVLRGFGLAPDRVADLCQDVLIQVFQNLEDYLDKKWGYLVRSLTYLALTRLRSQRRAVPVSLDEPEALELPTEPRLDPVEVAERWTLLDLAHAHAVGQRKREGDRGPLRESWAQIKAIAEGQVFLRDLALLTLPEGADDAALKREQNRIHKAHERCRDQVGTAIRVLYEQGTFKEEDLEVALRQHRGLLRVKPGARQDPHD